MMQIIPTGIEVGFPWKTSTFAYSEDAGIQSGVRYRWFVLVDISYTQ